MTDYSELKRLAQYCSIARTSGWIGQMGCDENQILELIAENESLRKDAERYRWFRAQHWDSSAICAVVDPKTCTKLGSYCPSEQLLDQAVDAGIAISKEAPGV